MEKSAPWGGSVTGDAGPYSDDQWSDIWRKIFLVDRTVQGVLKNYGNELAVSGVTSPIDIATGAAIVDGKFYENDSATTLAIPTPAGATRIDCIVLRKNFAAQTVRVTRVAGAEGGGAPAISQVDGTTWDIKIAQASITTGGVITVTDYREWIKSGIAQVRDGGITLTFHGGSGALPVGVLGGFFLPKNFSVRITGWQVAEIAGNTPTLEIDLWIRSNPTVAGIPTNAQSITNGNEIGLTAAAVQVRSEVQIVTDGWSREHHGGSLAILNLDSNDTARIIVLNIDWEELGDAS